MEKLQEAILELHEARATVAAHQEVVAEKRAEIASSPVGLKLACCERWLADAKAEEAAAEAALKTAALARYSETGEKGAARKSAAWVSIRQTVNWKDDVALPWAEEHAPIVVKRSIDKRPFEAMVKAGSVPAEIAQIEESPSASVASDLTLYVI